MSLQTAMYYTLDCDECSANVHEGTDFSGFADVEGTLQLAADCDWQVVDAETDTPVEWSDVAVEDVKADDLVNLRFYCEDHRRPEHEDRP